jgi:hypothetical protein
VSLRASGASRGTATVHEGYARAGAFTFALTPPFAIGFFLARAIGAAFFRKS